MQKELKNSKFIFKKNKKLAKISQKMAIFLQKKGKNITILFLTQIRCDSKMLFHPRKFFQAHQGFYFRIFQTNQSCHRAKIPSKN